MIADMYKRRERTGYSFLILVLLMMAGWFIFMRPSGKEEWMETGFFLFPILLLIFISLSSRRKYNKVKNMEIEDSTRSLKELDHLVIQPDAGLYPRLLAFEKNGAYVGMLKVDNLPWWSRLLVAFRSSFLSFIPCTFRFYSNEGIPLFSLHRKGFKETVVEIDNEGEEKVGSYIQKEFKSLIHMKGMVKNSLGEEVLRVQASGLSGDFTLKDETGHTWAHFYNGRFPVEYTRIFRDIDNDIVELSDTLTKENKTLLLGTIGFLFIERSLRR
ncbi:hypothetical protein [Halobacillus kuroshimensis]|uniref:hypothetical protein n=1 Tax=Halobacillus kuroshimensis TaxID=302481 RepID=UPI00041BD153|nr:hypothetical protein [Halobacillus kuroshimensis]